MTAALLLAAALLLDCRAWTVRERSGLTASPAGRGHQRPRGRDPFATASALDVLAVCLSAGMAVPAAAAATADFAPRISPRSFGAPPTYFVPRRRPRCCMAGARRRIGRGIRRARETGPPIGVVGTALAAGVAELAEQCRQEVSHRATAAAERAGVLIAGPLGLCFLPAFVCLGIVPWWPDWPARSSVRVWHDRTRRRRGNTSPTERKKSIAKQHDRRDPGRMVTLAVDESGMSTVEYAIGTIAAAAFGAILYSVVTGDSIVGALTNIINRALTTRVQAATVASARWRPPWLWPVWWRSSCCASRASRQSPRSPVPRCCEEAARLAARGDTAAITGARNFAPGGAAVEIRRDGSYVVRARQRPVAGAARSRHRRRGRIGRRAGSVTTAGRRRCWRP